MNLMLDYQDWDLVESGEAVQDGCDVHPSPACEEEWIRETKIDQIEYLRAIGELSAYEASEAIAELLDD